MSTYVWTDSYWINVKDEPYIMIYGRNYDNPYETRIFKVKNFKPYFYAPADEVRGDGEELIDAYGRRVKKVTCALPSHVPYERDFFSWTDEADIPFDLRFMIDAGIYYAFDEKLKPVEVQKPIKPRICYFDIEVSKPDGTLPDFHSPHHPVVMIQCLDSYTDEIKIFTWNIPKVSDEQILCKNEKMLFFQFSQYILKNDFDVLCGWFSNSFDLPYLKARADFLRANLSIGRPPNISDIYASDNGVRIPGRQAFDLLDAFKKWHSAKGELESYSLKSIAKTFCNFVYEDYGDSIARMMEEGDYETLLEYGRNDVIALKLIDEKLGLINFFEYIRFIVGCKLEDTLFNGKVVDTLLLRETERPLPTKERREAKNYTGAFVLEPPVGIHEWVGVFDLASLYPTIMIAFNVSPDIDKIIPKTALKILNERERLRKLRLEGKADESTKLKEYVLKTIANSFYGVQGWSGFRMYDRECAEFVTRKGRELIQYLINCAEDLGFNVLYSDSVRGDMRVFVKDKGYVKIEDLFKDVSYSIFDKEYYIPQEDIYVLSMSKDGKVEFKKVKYVMRHYIDDEIREVVLDEKKKIYLTKEHSIMKYINKRERRRGSGVYEVVKPDDLLGKSVIYQKKYGGYDDGIRNKNMERFWELVGFVYGDGWWGKNKYYVKVSFGNDVDELVEYFGQLKETGLITNIYRSKHRKGDVTILSKKLKKVMDSFKINGKKVIPSWVLNLPYRYRIAFVRGYFSADGTVTLRNGHSIITLSSIDVENIKIVHEILMSISIEASIFRENRENQYKGKKLGTYTWRLNVLDVNKFMQLIGFVIERKNKKFVWRKERTSNEFGIRRVKEVNKVRFRGYVYDIEVEDNHNFFVENILVHNTDSLFIKPIDSERFGKELEKYFNSKLKEWADEHNAQIPPKLKFEKLFRRILFKKKIGSKGSAKKRYAGWLVWEDGQETDVIKTVGMETKRSDVAEITKELMHEVFELLLREGDIEKMSNIVKEAYWNLDKYPLSKIAIPKGVKKKRNEYKTNSAWIRGMKNAEELLGLSFSYEEKPRLIYLEQPVNVICIKEDMDRLPENFIVDWNKMRDRVIKQRFASIFDSIGLSWEQLIEGQTVLERWFE